MYMCVCVYTLLMKNWILILGFLNYAGKRSLYHAFSWNISWWNKTKRCVTKNKVWEYVHCPKNKRTRAGGGGWGLVLFWKLTIDVTVEGFSKNYIDAITNKNKENEWWFIGFYGRPKTQKRFESWDLLRSLDRTFQISWLCAGDFNELIRSDEKLGDNKRSHN